MTLRKICLALERVAALDYRSAFIGTLNCRAGSRWMTIRKKNPATNLWIFDNFGSSRLPSLLCLSGIESNLFCHVICRMTMVEQTMDAARMKAPHFEIRIAVVGTQACGKSSLLNALFQRKVSHCSAEFGTKSINRFLSDSASARLG